MGNGTSPWADRGAIDREREMLDVAHSMDLWISYVLRGGVLIAAAIILVGLALFLAHGPGGSVAPWLRARPIATSPALIARGVLARRPLAVIQLGVLALILTPLARVALTAVLFVVERDWVFVAITATVLVILALGLLGTGA